MKAIFFTRYGSPDTLRLQDVPKPTPGPNEVLIRVKATAVNDWDAGLVTGVPFIIRVINGLFRPRVHIPGVDVAGVIEAVGEKVTSFRVGDAVFGDLSESGFGAFAEYVAASENAVLQMPEEMSFEDAAAIPHAAMLAWQGLIEKGAIQSGQQVLINGAGGGVGTLAIQLAKMYDVKVTGVDSAEKLPMLTELGFDEVIDYRKTDFTADKEKYDLVLDVKTNRPPSSYLRCLKPNGRYITVGGATMRLIQINLFGKWFGRKQHKKLEVLNLVPNKDLAEIISLFKSGKIKPYIGSMHTLRELPEVLQFFIDGRHQGKIVIRI